MKIKYLYYTLGFVILFILAVMVSKLKHDLIEHYNLEGQPISTQVYFYDSYEEVELEFERMHGYTKSVEGFSELYPEDLECEVHTLRIRHQNDTYRIELLGHEFLHCIYGNWHPE